MNFGIDGMWIGTVASVLMSQADLQLIREL